MNALIATRLTEYELGQADACPMVEIAHDVAGLFPEVLDDPRVDARIYIVAVPRREVDFVRVMAAPAPHRAPTVSALRRAARRAA
jgi:hypothetical protein